MSAATVAAYVRLIGWVIFTVGVLIVGVVGAIGTARDRARMQRRMERRPNELESGTE